MLRRCYVSRIFNDNAGVMDAPEQESADTPRMAMSISREADSTLLIRLAGKWSVAYGLASIDEIQREIDSGSGIRRIAFDTGNLTAWDSSLLACLTRLIRYCNRSNIEIHKEGLPGGVTRLLDLALAVPEKKDARRDAARTSFFSMVGENAINFIQSAGEMLSFIGEASLTFLRLVRGKARFRRSDLMLLIEESGADALPIVSLISVLVGLILAFVGAVQLKLFGAQIYVANLVGLGMAREMGAMMTAIIMAGRTGAAYAARLGTMQVNEEIDALRTLGISPMELLVLPRMLALVLMMPLLTIYADLMGILGGAIIGVATLDISVVEYFQATRSAVTVMDFTTGLIKGGVFGVLVALSGCLRGMQCGRSASAVGDATTSAVVTAIVSIIVADSILTVIYDILGV